VATKFTARITADLSQDLLSLVGQGLLKIVGYWLRDGRTEKAIVAAISVLGLDDGIGFCRYTNPVFHRNVGLATEG
jgi:hypothetical protein